MSIRDKIGEYEVLLGILKQIEFEKKLEIDDSHQKVLTLYIKR